MWLTPVVLLTLSRRVQIELIEGPDLLDYIEQCNRQMPEELALHYFRQLLDAVAYLHATGIAHRDLKPENCMIDLRSHTLKVNLMRVLSQSQQCSAAWTGKFGIGDCTRHCT